jgi:hypothetical protein
LRDSATEVVVVLLCLGRSPSVEATPRGTANLMVSVSSPTQPRRRRQRVTNEHSGDAVVVLGHRTLAAAGAHIIPFVALRRDRRTAQPIETSSASGVTRGRRHRRSSRRPSKVIPVVVRHYSGRGCSLVPVAVHGTSATHPCPGSITCLTRLRLRPTRHVTLADDRRDRQTGGAALHKTTTNLLRQAHRLPTCAGPRLHQPTIARAQPPSIRLFPAP